MARLAAAAVLTMGAALLLAPLRGHVDDTDAQHYQVLARALAQSRTWSAPQPDPDSLRPFTEHLPFGLWPFAAAARWPGEEALPLVGAAFSMGTLSLVLWLGTRLAGLRAGLIAAAVLALTETFFAYGARPRIDALLIFLSLAAAAPFLLGTRAWTASAALAAAAVLVKGPFGLVPLCAAAAARAVIDRSPRALVYGGLAALAALVPAAIFLFWDRAHGGPYWEWYLHRQVLGSALGARVDGTLTPWFPLQTIAGRFWPGLPLALAGLWLASQRKDDRALRTLALATLFAVAALCLPARKVWNHALVAYPLLALLAGAAAARLTERLSMRALTWAWAALAAAAIVLSATGAIAGAALRPPCVPSAELAAEFAGIPAATPILVVPREWPLVESLAAEQRLSPWALDTLPAEPAASAAEAPGRAGEARRARLALWSDAAGAPPPAPWRVRARARGWALLER